jgi:hypothetical protein
MADVAPDGGTKKERMARAGTGRLRIRAVWLYFVG